MIQELPVAGAVAARPDVTLEPRAVAAFVRARLAETPNRERAARADLHRQAALAALDLDDARGGLADARRSVRLAALADDAELEGRCRTALVRALAFVGRLAEALREIERAEPLLRGRDLGRLRLQRMLVLYKMGDHRAAFDAVNSALRLLPRGSPDSARALNNRGLLRLYVGGFKEGLADLAKARTVYQTVGMVFAAAEVRTNLGMMLDRLGDVAGALEELEDAERELRALDVPVDRDIVYRAEVLLAARLFEDVRLIVPGAVSRLEAAGMHADAAEGRFYVAQALVLARAQGAAEEARAARTVFAKSRRWGWAALAHLTEMQARLDTGDHSVAAYRDAFEAALALQRAGLVVQEREAWLIAGRFAARSGRSREATQCWECASRTRRAMTLAEQLPAIEARARLWRAVGNETATLRACHRGLTLIEEHVLALSATDLRVSASGRGTNLAQIGVEIAWRRGEPRTLFHWVERWRAAGLWLAPVRPPPDVRLATLLTELRAAAVESREAMLDDDPSTGDSEARRRVGELERAVQVASRRRTAAPVFSPARRAGPHEVHELLGDRAMVELVQCEGRVGALVLADRRTTFHELGPLAPVAECAEALRFALERLARVGHESHSAVAVRSARLQLEQLQRLLGAPLRGRLDGHELVVVPDLAVHHLPWSWILGEGQPTSVAPSASLWHRAAMTDLRAGGHVTVVAGPGLAGAEAEARRVAQLHPGARLLVGAAATVEAVGAALDGARVAHLAAHGTYRRDNPLFSGIELADGPAVVHDLERISRPPSMIVLASCNSALGQLQASNDVVGLAAALLAAGTRVALAAVVPLPDAEIVDIMVRLHAGLAVGAAPAAALAEAAATEDRSDRLHLLAAAALVCFGAG